MEQSITEGYREESKGVFDCDTLVATGIEESSTQQSTQRKGDREWIVLKETIRFAAGDYLKLPFQEEERKTGTGTGIDCELEVVSGEGERLWDRNGTVDETTKPRRF